MQLKDEAGVQVAATPSSQRVKATPRRQVQRAKLTMRRFFRATVASRLRSATRWRSDPQKKLHCAACGFDGPTRQQSQTGGQDFRDGNTLHAGDGMGTAGFPMNARNAVMTALAFDAADHAVLNISRRQPQLGRSGSKNADARNPQRSGDVQQARINANEQIAGGDG